MANNQCEPLLKVEGKISISNVKFCIGDGYWLDKWMNVCSFALKKKLHQLKTIKCNARTFISWGVYE